MIGIVYWVQRHTHLEIFELRDRFWSILAAQINLIYCTQQYWTTGKAAWEQYSSTCSNIVRKSGGGLCRPPPPPPPPPQDDAYGYL